MCTALASRPACAVSAWEELLVSRSGMEARALAMRDPAAAAAMAGSWGLIPIKRQRSRPAPAVMMRSMGMKRNPRTRLILIHTDGFFDQQVHSRREAEQCTDGDSP